MPTDGAPIYGRRHHSRHPQYPRPKAPESTTTSVATASAGALKRPSAAWKDFRRIATRYDKLARNYASAVALAVIIAFWC